MHHAEPAAMRHDPRVCDQSRCKYFSGKPTSIILCIIGWPGAKERESGKEWRGRIRTVIGEGQTLTAGLHHSICLSLSFHYRYSK